MHTSFSLSLFAHNYSQKLKKTNMKLKANLQVVDEYVISYETKVAKIEGNNLIELGKYSNTTSRHVAYAANQLGLNLIRSKERKHFEKLPYGTRIV